ncbi:MAG: asparagine synthase (glutamine-hydrolysing) [Parcubacteria group bacterium Licking1014_1]|nr:MAG: asparagine synthase (glutamine-hydrolysing) [Parcubacteria group bacterium Licking1014_1]
MCGIAGIYNLKRKPADAFLIQKMTDSLEHRGPDDAGIYLDGNVALGHRRLSIIDLSFAGHQPMSNKEKTLFIVFNGEIYNFEELRKDLERLGYQFNSKTDTEVILYSYQEWGENCLQKINGMFAFAIFDKKNQQIFLARDRLGEKPLYYYFDSEKFVFASEIKAILEDKTISREIGAQGMVNYFAFGHSIAPDTIYRSIKKLLPGNYLILKNGQIITKKYWILSVCQSIEDKGKEYYKEEIIRTFEKAVRERLVSDVPLGVFLSGGVDSSAVVAMMSKIGATPIKTFSVGFNIVGREFNELADAKIVADYFKTEHREMILEEKDMVNTLNKLVYHFDEPFGDAANFPVFLMSQFARKYVTVILTGEGGDEIFGGYRRYIIEKNRFKLLFLNFIFKNNLFKGAVDLLPKLRKTKKLINSFSIEDDLSRYASWIAFFSKDMQDSLFNKNFLTKYEDPLKMHRQYFSQFKSADWVDKIMYLDQKILLPDRYLEKVDKASMAVGLETRPPILDYHLVELANSIPLKYKIRGYKTKCIFKEAMAGVLPKTVLNKKKHGFAVPTNVWFRGKLKNYLFEVIFDKKTRERGYFDYEYIEKLYKLYQNGNQPLDSQLWLLLNFELWHRQFID